jgi:hypothetical protein
MPSSLHGIYHGTYHLITPAAAFYNITVSYCAMMAHGTTIDSTAAAHWHTYAVDPCINCTVVYVFWCICSAAGCHIATFTASEHARHVQPLQ